MANHPSKVEEIAKGVHLVLLICESKNIALYNLCNTLMLMNIENFNGWMASEFAKEYELQCKEYPCPLTFEFYNYHVKRFAEYIVWLVEQKGFEKYGMESEMLDEYLQKIDLIY